MKKCACLFKNNYHYIILLLTFAAILCVTLSADLFGDDYFYMKPAVSSFPVVLQFFEEQRYRYSLAHTFCGSDDSTLLVYSKTVF